MLSANYQLSIVAVPLWAIGYHEFRNIKGYALIHESNLFFHEVSASISLVVNVDMQFVLYS